MAQQLRLFGQPQILHTGQWQTLPANQILMLAAYLAYDGDWLERDQLAHLFWSESPEARARRNLNQLLYACKTEAWLTGLEIENTALRWQIPSDVDDFRQAIADADWAQASSFRADNLLAASFSQFAP